MTKETKAKAFGLELSNLGKTLMESPSSTPMQKITVKKIKEKVETSVFTVHIPTDLFDQVREIAFKERRTIKGVIIEALELYTLQKK